MEIAELAPVSVYVHVPFCLKRHRASAPDVCEAGPQVRHAYLDALAREIEAARDLIADRPLQSLYVGGGPSLLRSDEFARVLLNLKRTMKPVRGMEFTIRFAPETLTSATLSGFNVCSFNRIAVEALCQRDKDFALLEAPFSYGTVEDGMNMTSLFKYPSCDAELVYGLPGQSPKAFENELCTYANFRNVSHITLTPYAGARDGGPQGDDSQGDALLAERFDQAVDYLGERGFMLYGANRFARERKECRFFYHECIGVDRIGFGAGARTVLDGYSYANTSDVGRYIEHSADFEQIVVDPVRLDGPASLLRRLALRLQLAEGFDLGELAAGVVESADMAGTAGTDGATGAAGAAGGTQTARELLRDAIDRLVEADLASRDAGRVQATRLALRAPERVRAALLG